GTSSKIRATLVPTPSVGTSGVWTGCLRRRLPFGIAFATFFADPNQHRRSVAEERAVEHSDLERSGRGQRRPFVQGAAAGAGPAGGGIPRRPLGRTGVMVSALGMGGHHLG